MQTASRTTIGVVFLIIITNVFGDDTATSPLVYDFESSKSVGAKGELRYLINYDPLRCGEPIRAFDHVQIVFRQRRFGDAQIISTPSPGCTDCEPVVVRWYHEPTGRLDFQVQVYHRQTVISCNDHTLPPDSSLFAPASHEYGIADSLADSHTVLNQNG